MIIIYKEVENLKHLEKCKGSQDAVVQSIINIPPSETDPEGSYTGKPIYTGETPVQDADDL